MEYIHIYSSGITLPNRIWIAGLLITGVLPISTYSLTYVRVSNQVHTMQCSFSFVYCVKLTTFFGSLLFVYQVKLMHALSSNQAGS